MVLSLPSTCSSVKSKEPIFDVIQGLRESEEGVYRVFARVSSSTFDWLLELIKSTITKQHAVYLWSISP